MAFALRRISALLAALTYHSMVVRKASEVPECSGTETTNDLQSCAVCGVIENRAKEVGIAALDTASSTLSLMQFVEVSRTYTTVLSALLVFQPSTLVTLGSTKDLPTHDVNRATRRRYQQVPLGRGAFDDTKATLALESVAAPSSRADLDSALMRSRYYLALGAAGAVLRYMEQEHGSVLTAGSLDIQYRSLADRMQIDLAGVQALELIEPLTRDPGISKCNCSLFNRLKQTKTTAGMRLLRVSRDQLLEIEG